MGEMKTEMECDESTFSSVVHGCAQTRNWPVAERLLSEMRTAGFKPNDACYYALLSAASKAGEVSLAEKLLRGMQADGMPPDLYAYSAVRCRFWCRGLCGCIYRCGLGADVGVGLGVGSAVFSVLCTLRFPFVWRIC